MQFGIQREVLLKPLQQVIGVVERRQTLPVLSNLLVSASEDRVTFTGTDLEVEMSASIEATGKAISAAFAGFSGLDRAAIRRQRREKFLAMGRNLT